MGSILQLSTSVLKRAAMTSFDWSMARAYQKIQIRLSNDKVYGVTAVGSLCLVFLFALPSFQLT